MRYWLRAYKNWPTYPQVYANGQFVGGLDVVKDLVAKGEFAKLIPDSSKTQDPEQKYKLLTSENEVIAFTSSFSFESKETENFLNAQKEKYKNLPVVNVSLDSNFSEYIKGSLKQELPFIVVKG